MKYLFLILTLVAFFSNCNRQTEEVYLFSYFQDNGQDGLHLAYSEDGYSWNALNNNQSLLAPQVGESKLMRDPSIIRGGDGKFHLVWTTGWAERGIGYASSKDLVHWSEQRYIPVMAHEPTARNCWAPELHYDSNTKTYLIYWATTIPGRFQATDDTGDDGYNHRMYYTTTTDFEHFSHTRLLYDQGFNVIDAVIKEINGKYLMFLKNETRYPLPEKNIRIAQSSQLTQGYGQASSPITPADIWVEGPTVLQIGKEWLVYFDQYRNHRMGAVRSTDLSQWEDVSEDVNFPEGTRHGTAFTVSRETFNQLRKSITISTP